MRHGKTGMNRDGRYQGRTDVPLCPEGEAELLAGGVFPQVEKVYVSPMQRARRTAALCFPNAAQTVVDDFREMDFGAFEGRNYQEMADDPAYRAWVDGMCRGECPDGESMSGFTERVCAAFKEVLHAAAEAGEKRLIIVAHGGTVMALLSRCAVPERDYYDWSVPNGGGYAVHLDGRRRAPLPVLTGPVLFERLSALPEEWSRTD